MFVLTSGCEGPQLCPRSTVTSNRGTPTVQALNLRPVNVTVLREGVIAVAS